MKDRMLRGELYRADDPELEKDLARAQRLLDVFNSSKHDEHQLRDNLIRELLGSVGANVTIKPTFRCDYGTYISIGDGTFVNYDCVMLDVARIRIGAACQLAPGVQLLTATHPLDPVARLDGWESARPITIADNVWLGGAVIVCPGVSIGENSVVGAGAVVTKDLPANILAVGNPARILRPLPTPEQSPVDAG